MSWFKFEHEEDSSVQQENPHNLIRTFPGSPMKWCPHGKFIGSFKTQIHISSML